MNNEITKSSFWSRPGGKIGTILPLAGLGVAGYFLLPILTAIIWTTINFAIACISGVVLLWIITNKKLRKRALLIWELLMKGLVSIIVDVDPFIISEKRIEKAREDREKLKIEAGKVLGVAEKLRNDISERETKKLTYISSAKNAANSGDKEFAALNQQKAIRAENYIKTVSPLKDKLNNIGESLLKVYKTSEYTIESMQDELDTQKATWEGLTAGNKALGSFQRMWKGDPDDFMLQQQAAENLKNRISEKVVGITIGMAEVGNFMKTIDYETGSYDETALKRLEASTTNYVDITKNQETIKLKNNKFNEII